MYYKHSGRFNLAGLVIAALVGGAASLVLAFAYGHGVIYIPEVRLAALATLAFGALVGLATGQGLVWGKVRNDSVGMAVSGAISALALYLSWAMWVSAILETQHVTDVSWTQLAQHPGALWHLMCLINQYGTWAISSGSATNGWALWLIWFFEAALVIGAGVFAGIGILGHHPFCESCGCWCSRGAKFVLAAPQNVPQLKLQLEANDFRSLESLGSGNKATDHLVVALDSCERCRQFHTMSLTHTTIRKSKTGKPTISNTMIVQHLLVGAGQADVVRHLSDTLGQATETVPKVNAAAAGKK